MSEEIVDLDIIRPAKRNVKLAGKVVDISFIPCGITFEVDKLVRELQSIDQRKLAKDESVQVAGLDATIKLCSLFFSVKHPEMDAKWFRENVSIVELNVIADSIREALKASYEGVERYGKN